MFFEQTQIFQEGYSKRHVFSRGSISVRRTDLLSHRTDTNFPRNPYLVLEHIYEFSRSLYFLIEQIQFSRRPLWLEHMGIFQEGTPLEQIFR